MNGIERCLRCGLDLIAEETASHHCHSQTAKNEVWVSKDEINWFNQTPKLNELPTTPSEAPLLTTPKTKQNPRNALGIDQNSRNSDRPNLDPYSARQHRRD